MRDMKRRKRDGGRSGARGAGAMGAALPLLVALLVLVVAGTTRAATRGVLADSTAGGGLRAAANAEAPVAVALAPGEPFVLAEDDGAGWCRVTLDSGATGWLPRGDIHLFYTEADLPASGRDPGGPSEIAQAALSQGFNYARTVRQAARGDARALKRLFGLADIVDGAAAESFRGIPTAVYHLLGDAAFARFLAGEPSAYRVSLRNIVVGDCPLPPGVEYLRRHFPASTATLFWREMVAWPSPNGRYAIRKRFSDAFRFEGSTVERAELIEAATGRVLCDLTPDDIGTGPEREGRVLWAPDSKRVACLSCDLPESPGHLFSTPRPALQRKRTTVYQQVGEGFRRVDLPLDEPPDRAADADLKDAVPGHLFTEPLRWESPTLLLLRRHDYFGKMVPISVGGSTFHSIEERARQYVVRVTFDAEGRARVRWKLVDRH